jgi:hypothetical protein
MDISNTDYLSAADTSLVFTQTTVIKVQPLQIKGGITAILAPSCLMQVQVGDMVACAISSQGTAYILAVLERLDPAADMILSSKSPISVHAPQLNLAATKVNVVADELIANIGLLRRLIDRVEDVVGSLVASFDSIFIRAARSIRRVEELDELTAGHVKIDSPALVEISGEVTTIAGEELIKMQSQQIHMG